jgi:hypothetical protein
MSVYRRTFSSSVPSVPYLCVFVSVQVEYIGTKDGVVHDTAWVSRA